MKEWSRRKSRVKPSPEAKSPAFHVSEGGSARGSHTKGAWGAMSVCVCVCVTTLTITTYL